jgi:hypothetical protein
MKTFLFFRRGRYALASLAVAGALVAAAACQPTKKPPPPTPAPGPCNGGSGACLTLAPNSWTFTSRGEIKTFTVGNLGPDPSTPLVVGATASFTFDGGQSSCFSGANSAGLFVGETCTLAVTPAIATGQGQLRVWSENSQRRPDGPGVFADLFPPP